MSSQGVHRRSGRDRGPYVVLEDVAGDEGLVDARVLVRLEVLQRFLGDAFVRGSFCDG